MIKSILILMFMCAVRSTASAQSAELPLKEWPSQSEMPFVLYLSGDGGFNTFTTTLCEAINKNNYSVAAINSKTYFWEKKTPEQACQDISSYLDKQFKNRSSQQLVLIGYSFGADVMSFIVNRMNPELRAKVTNVVLISPSTSTDFEIHWSDMFGGNAKRSMDVVAEINKMDIPKTSSFFGAEEKDFPVNSVQLKNYRNQTLPGGHRYDGHTEKLAEEIIKEIQ